MSDRQHGELWSCIGGLREDLGRAEERIAELEDRTWPGSGRPPQAAGGPVISVGPEALDLLTVQEVAARLRLSVKTVRRLVARGAIGSVKIGARVRIAPEAVAEYKDAGRPPA